MATLEPYGDAGVVQQPHRQQTAALFRAEAQPAAHLVRQVGHTRGVPGLLLLRDIEGTAQVGEYLDAANRAQRTAAHPREIARGRRIGGRTGSLLHRAPRSNANHRHRRDARHAGVFTYMFGRVGRALEGGRAALGIVRDEGRPRGR